VRRVGIGSKSPVVADSEILDAWIRHGGQVRLDALDTEAIIANSKRLIAELTEAQQDLRRRVSTLRGGIKEIREKQTALRRSRKPAVRKRAMTANREIF
jgi:hypothetical protein